MRIARYVPIVSWLPRYESRWLLRDSLAGVTVWGLLVPEMIAYASLAGLSPQAGLYTLLAAPPLYAIFGTSRQLVVAGTSASAVLVFAAVTALSRQSPTGYATLAAGMIVVAGIIFIVAGFLRLGFITAFLSRPVMDGFVFGLAIFVTISQLPKIFGIEKGSGDTLRQLGHLFTHLSSTSVATLAVGASALVLLFALGRFMPKAPGALVVLVLALAVSAGADLASHGVAIVGSIPKGLPTGMWPKLRLEDFWVLLPSTAGMVLVIFSEALGAGEVYAHKHGYRLDSNQEMIALGVANLGSGLLGGLAAGGSLSQTAVNDGAGARSEVSPLVATVLALVTVVALTPVFKDLPEAVLAALIIYAVSHLMRVGAMRRYYRLVPREFWLGILTLAGVVVFGVLPGLIIGVVTALIVIVYLSSRPQVSELGWNPSARGYFDIRRHPGTQPIPGVLIVRPDAALFYANARGLRDAISRLVTDAPGPLKAAVLDLEANDELDITSVDELNQLATALARRRLPFALAHAHDPVLSLLQRSETLSVIGADHVFANLDGAVAWAKTLDPAGRAEEGRPG
jgi:high affinity sulfate transporter 1